MNHKAFIFDMDGVMVDTEPIYFAANQQLFNQLGFSVSHESYARFVGQDAFRMWSILKEEQQLDHPIEDLVHMEKDAMYRGLLNTDIPRMSGLGELLASLQSNGTRLALASSSAHQIINVILEKTDTGDYFDAVVSGMDVQNGKPAPDIFLLAAEKLGMDPAECVVIEDSANGVRGAIAAGMHCIGFRNPNSGNQDLSPAHRIIDHLSELDPAEL